jgi:hypothetical protein
MIQRFMNRQTSLGERGHGTRDEVFGLLGHVSPLHAIEVEDCHLVRLDDVLDVVTSEGFVAREESEDCHTKLGGRRKFVRVGGMKGGKAYREHVHINGVALTDTTAKDLRSNIPCREMRMSSRLPRRGMEEEEIFSPGVPHLPHR